MPMEAVGRASVVHYKAYCSAKAGIIDFAELCYWLLFYSVELRDVCSSYGTQLVSASLAGNVLSFPIEFCKKW